MHKTDLMTVQEVAKRLGIAKRTVHQRIELGNLYPATKLPGRTGAYLFDRAYIERIAARDRDHAKALAAQGEATTR